MVICRTILYQYCDGNQTMMHPHLVMLLIPRKAQKKSRKTVREGKRVPIHDRTGNTARAHAPTGPIRMYVFHDGTVSPYLLRRRRFRISHSEQQSADDSDESGNACLVYPQISFRLVVRGAAMACMWSLPSNSNGR